EQGCGQSMGADDPDERPGAASAQAGRLRSAVKHAFNTVLVLAVVVAVTFLTLPIVAIFWQVGLARLVDGLRGDIARDVFRVTLKTNAIAMALILGVGTPAAYFLATRRFVGGSLVVTFLALPLGVHRG